MFECLFDLDFISKISSVIGLLVTGFLYYEARSIRRSFLTRARLPEIMKELVAAVSTLSKNVKDWKSDKQPTLLVLQEVKALLENISPKVSKPERVKVDAYLLKLSPSNSSVQIERFEADQIFKLYNELVGLVSTLKQVNKDSSWS